MPGVDLSYPALEARVRGAFPGFRGTGIVHPSIKARVIEGSLEGRSVVAKLVVRRERAWHWYLAREIDVYGHFTRHPPPVCAPALVAADAERGVLVIERASGAPLSRARRAANALAPGVAATLLGDALSLADAMALDAFACAPAPPEVTATLRHRLLEDPSAALAWHMDGIERCRTLGIVTDRDCALITRALVRCPRVRFAHGDLLLRNVVAGAEGLTYLDWECAGAHPIGWDCALLWAGLAPADRAGVEAHWAGRGCDEEAAFWACAAFAAAREVKFRRHSFRAPPHDRGLVAALADVACALGRLAALSAGS